MKEVIAWIVVICIIVFGTVAGVYSTGWATCTAQWQDYEYSYGFWEGCMVEVDEKMVPQANFRVIQE